MKKLCFLLILVICGTFLHSQTIIQKEIDEFTGTEIIKTSWAPLHKAKFDFSMMIVMFRVSRINGLVYLNTKLHFENNKVFAVDEDGIFMLKLTSGEVMELEINEFKVTSRGGSAIGILGSDNMGMQLSYYLTDEDIIKLKSDPPVKFRVYTTDGYTENDTGKKTAKRLIKMFTLIGK